MNKRQLGALLAVNLRLLNPQATDRYRKKGKTGAELTNKLKLQFLTNTILFLAIYGFTMFSIDFSKKPGMFTFYVGLFVLLGISQSISGLYNVFFAGKDINSYLPLPFRQSEIFLSKVLIVAFNVIPFTLPLLIAFFLTGWHSGIMIPMAVVMALVVYLMIMTIIFMFCALIVFALTKTKVFREHQSLVMNGLMGITMVIAIGGIMLMSNSDNYSATGASYDRSVISIFMPIFQIFNVPVSINSGISWLGLLALLAVFGGILKYLIVPQLSEQLTTVNSAMLNGTSHRKAAKRQGLNANLDSYNWQLLKEPNLLLQVVMNSVMIPVIFIISFSFAKLPSDLPLKWIGVFFVAGIAFSSFTTNQSALVGNLISLDRANFEFVRSLPFSLKQYLHRKFLFGYLMQFILNVVIVIIMSVVLKAGLIMALALICGSAWGTYLMILHYFSRDYRLRLTNWTNVTELFNRGGGNLGMVTTMFVSVFISVIVIVVYSMLLINTPWAAMINIVVLAVILITSWLLLRHYRVKFWNQFD